MVPGRALRPPWPVLFGLKVALGRLPLPYRFWRRLGLFRHGCMDDPDYAERVFHRHFDDFSSQRRGAPFDGLKLGPGDSLFSAFLARREGARSIILLDVAPYAAVDLGRYQTAARRFFAGRPDRPPVTEWRALDDALRWAGARYLTRGLAALRLLPSESVDFIWSQAVLQSVCRAELGSLLMECRRVLRRDGYSSHQVDFRDLFGGGLNHLRFGERVWESEWLQRSPCYANRCRLSDIGGLAESAGFSCEARDIQRWEVLPIDRARLEPAFAHRDQEDLLVWSARLVMRPR